MKPLKILAAIIVAVVILLAAMLGGAACWLHIDEAKTKVIGQATRLLSEKLQTRVAIDSASFDVLHLDLNLYGLDVEDQQQRKLLQAEHLAAKMRLLPLLRHELDVNKVLLKGVKADISKDSAGRYNYQFIVDAFKKDSTKTKKTPTDSTKKHPMTFDIKHVALEDIEVRFDDKHFYLQRLDYKCKKRIAHHLEIKGLEGQWKSKSKKGPVDNQARIGALKGYMNGGERWVTIDRLRYATDNHLPRKNTGRPKFGFFDAGHMDILAKVRINVLHVAKDTIVAEVRVPKADDDKTGFHVTDLNLDVAANKKVANISDFSFKQRSTTLQFKKATINLPNKKTGAKFSFQTSRITGVAILKDIAKPFAPPLAGFKIPLLVSVYFSGDDNNLYFKKAHVSTTDYRLDIKANGRLHELVNKYKLDIHFDVDQMQAKRNVVQDIINQFPLKKKFMMKEMSRLGVIRYKGDFWVGYKKERFWGTLSTAVGRLYADVLINNTSKYITGSINTKNIHLGKVFELENVADVSCKADFQFDFDKKRTAAVRRRLGGKLPIGHVVADVPEATYKMLKVKRVHAEIRSDGAVAKGSIVQRNKNLDLLCDFTFDNTDGLKKIRLKPNVKLHFGGADAKSEKSRMEKKAKKEARAKEKARKKQERDEQRKAEKAAKEQQRLEKQQQKAEAKRQKAAAKEQRRLEKQARKNAAKNSD